MFFFDTLGIDLSPRIPHQAAASETFNHLADMCHWNGVVYAKEDNLLLTLSAK